MNDDLAGIFITREMLIREPNIVLCKETKRRSALGFCVFCGTDLLLFNLAEGYEHNKACRIRAWDSPVKKVLTMSIE